MWLKTLFHWLWQSPLLLGLVVYIAILLGVAFALFVTTLNLHKANERKARQWQAMEDRWKPLMMKVISGEKWPQSVHDQIKSHESLFFIDFLMRYADKLHGQSRKRVTQLAEPYLSLLLKRLHKGDAEQRARAILTLSVLAPEQHNQRLAQALEDPSPLVAMLAARSLAENKSLEYLKPILDKMPRFRSWSQNFLISMLKSLAQQHPEVLREALLDPSRPDWVKTIILKALTDLSDWQSLPLAAQFLEENGDRDLQAAALQFIARIGHAGLADLVRKKLDDPDFVIRLNAVKALSSLGDLSDGERLLALLKEDPSQWIAYQAAQALKVTRNLESLYQVASTQNPRTELAKEVLYDLDSWETIEFLIRLPGFIEYVPQWIRTVKRRDIRDAWKQVQNALLSPQAHLSVQQKMAHELDNKAPDWLFQSLLQAFLEQRNAPPKYLSQALINANPERASQVFIKWFYEVHNADSQYHLFCLLAADPRSESVSFFKDLQKRLQENPELFSQYTDLQQKELRAQTQKAVHQSLLNTGA